MAEQQKPRKGDKVRVTFEAAFLADDMGTRMVDVADGMGPIPIVLPAWATVEVLERADDPAKNQVGAIRRQPAGGSEDGNGSDLGVIAIRWASEKQTNTPWVYMRWDGPQLLSNESVVGWELATSLPWSPAWQAEQAEIEHTDLFEPEDYPEGCQNHAPSSLEPEARPAEIRKLLVHPTVWLSLTAWLHGMRIKVVPALGNGVDSTPTYAMTPMWGSDA